MQQNKIPEQFTGKQLDYSKTVTFATSVEAATYFQEVRKRSLSVNEWHRIANVPSAEFKIMNSSGQIQDRTLQEGDWIRIDIPGPGLPSADGYDWVRVEKIASEDTGTQQEIVITLRPCPDPSNNNPDTAHFFTHLATSSFILRRSDSDVLIHYAGRNEVINTENISAWDNFRNFLIGLGAKLGASYPQWKGLVDGLSDVQPEGSPDQIE